MTTDTASERQEQVAREAKREAYGEAVKAMCPDCANHALRLLGPGRKRYHYHPLTSHIRYPCPASPIWALVDALGA